MLSTLRRLTNLTLVEHTRLQQHTALSLGLRIPLSAITLLRHWSLLPHIAFSPPLSQVPFFPTRCPPDRFSPLINLATTVRHGNGRYVPRSCLLFKFLRARQESVELCLDISKHRTLLDGHVRIERDGIVLGDARSFTNRYAPILLVSA